MYQDTYLIRDIWECPADLITILTSVKGFGAGKVINIMYIYIP